ncbi:MAG: hypothetical protein ABR600_12705 [Actinomycetota bacterium]
MLEQGVQIVGALLILAAFGFAQAGRLDVTSPLYLWLNVAGAATLAVLAVVEEQWGFVLLEVVWTIVSVWGLIKRSRAVAAAAAARK